jgi:membrane-associated protein
MEFIKSVIDFILHIDRHLVEIITSYQSWTYIILFLIVFAETGLVVTPFLPGDSLLFAAGAIIANSAPDPPLNIFLLWALLCIAAVVGDLVNYHIGKFAGIKAFSGKYSFLKIDYLHKTQEFYERHGGKTIIYARFIPIIRTFAPFVAGIGLMKYSKFAIFNITGGVAWVTSFLFIGFFFGRIPVVRSNFTLVIFAIIFISVLPPFVEVIRGKNKK